MELTKMITLIIPTKAEQAEVLDFKNEFLASHPGHIPGAPSLAESSTHTAWLQSIEKDLNNTDPTRVKATQYIAIDEEHKVVGVIQLRHALTPQLLETGGNIGYSVRPIEQGKGYATNILHLCLTKAREIGLNKTLITCDIDNIGSARVIEKNGGVLEDIRGNTKRYWITF